MFGEGCYAYSKIFDLEIADNSSEFSITFKAYDEEYGQISEWGIHDLVISLELCEKPCFECSISASTCTSCIYPNYLLSSTCVNTCPDDFWGYLDLKENFWLY